ncbi:MAG: ABC transporter ATP-binding protein [Thermoplasmata archaeon]|nr:ABC transporter ATP-binding protein [Thermoplasmata archaeon]
MTPAPSIEVRGLTKQFQGRAVLDHASFRYSGNRIVGYLGPNGAGKTTTLKLLTGLLRASEGAAFLDGIDIAERPKEALSRVGAVIETPEPYPELKVQEALQMAGRFRGLTPETIADRTRVYGSKLELPPMDRRCGKLSKGQRQRVVLAATLMAEPPILLLDEPTSGLDPAERIRVRNALLEAKPRTLVLMSSHLLNEVTEICDDVVFLNNGRVVRQGSIREVTDAMVVREVEVEFVAPVDLAQMAAVQALTEQGTALGPRRFRLRFDGRVETRIRILEACQRVAPVLEYSPAGSALEGAYLAVMGEVVPPPPPAPPAT